MVTLTFTFLTHTPGEKTKQTRIGSSILCYNSVISPKFTDMTECIDLDICRLCFAKTDVHTDVAFSNLGRFKDLICDLTGIVVSNSCLPDGQTLTN